MLLKPLKFGLFLLALALAFGFGAYCATAEAQEAPEERSSEPRQELLDRRTKDTKTFRINGRFETIIGEDLHYMDTDGQWKDVDLTFHQVAGEAHRNGVHTLRNGDAYHMGGARVNSTVTRRGVEVVDPSTGIGIRWQLPGDARMEPEAANPRDRAKVASIGNGVVWELRNTPNGLKSEGIVQSAQGNRTYTFPYSLVGTEEHLELTGSGALQGEAFQVAPIVIIDAQGNRYGAEYSLSPGAVQFSFDDSVIPQDGYPYVIDPTVVFDVDASDDDCEISAGDTSWPPSTDLGHDIDCAADTISVVKSEDTGDFTASVAVLIWDTSMIPDDATIQAASLTLDGVDATNTGTRSLVVDWYAGVPPATLSDWVLTGDGTAGSFGLTGFAGTTETRALSVVQNTISFTGDTSLLLSVSGGEPGVGDNFFLDFSSFDHASDDAPQLSITYTTPLELTEPDLGDVAAYRNVRQEGDFLIIAPYEITFDTVPPQLASQEYRALFQEGGFTLMEVRPVATSENGLAGYGDGFVSFYFTAEQAAAAGIVWNVPNQYTITLEAINGNQTDSTTAIDYDPADSEGLLPDLRALAQFLETSWGLDVISNNRLTVVGQDYFESVIPFIQEMLPDFVNISVLQPDTSTRPAFGDNLILNGGFEENADNWAETIDAGITGTSGQTTDESFEGVGSLHMEITAASNPGSIVRTQDLPAEPGQRWRGSVWVQTSGFSDAQARFVLRFNDSEGNNLGQQAGVGVDSSPPWVQVGIEDIQAPPETHSITFELGIEAVEAGGTIEVWWDDAVARNDLASAGEGFWAGTGIVDAIDIVGDMFSISARDVVTVVALIIGLAALVVFLLAGANPIVGMMGFGIAIIISGEIGLAPVIMVGLLAFIGLLAIVHMFWMRTAGA